MGHRPGQLNWRQTKHTGGSEGTQYIFHCYLKIKNTKLLTKSFATLHGLNWQVVSNIKDQQRKQMNKSSWGLKEYTEHYFMVVKYTLSNNHFFWNEWTLNTH